MYDDPIDPETKPHTLEFLEKARLEPVMFASPVREVPDDYLVGIVSTSPYFSEVFKVHQNCHMLIFYLSVFKDTRRQDVLDELKDI